MIVIDVRFLGGLEKEAGVASIAAELPEGATVADLGAYLGRMGIDREARRIVVLLDGRGLDQWPATRELRNHDSVAVFPVIAGGQATG